MINKFSATVKCIGKNASDANIRMIELELREKLDDDLWYGRNFVASIRLRWEQFFGRSIFLKFTVVFKPCFKGRIGHMERKNNRVSNFRRDQYQKYNALTHDKATARLIFNFVNMGDFLCGF